MARVHYSRFVGRAGKSRLPTKQITETISTAGGPVEVTRLVLMCRRGHPIEKGERYLWFAPGFRAAKRIGCMNHPPKPSELDSSAYSEILAAQEEFARGETSGTPDDIRASVDEAIQPIKDAIESVADQYEAAAEAMGGDYGAGGQFAEWAVTLRDCEVVDWTASDYSEEPEPCEDHADLDESGECEACTANIESWADGLWDEADEKVNDVSKE